MLASLISLNGIIRQNESGRSTINLTERGRCRALVRRPRHGGPFRRLGSDQRKRRRIQPREGEDCALREHHLTRLLRDDADPHRGGPRLSANTTTSRAGKIGIINKRWRRHLLGNRNPLGKKFGTDADTPPDIEIIGIVQDAKYVSSRETENVTSTSRSGKSRDFVDSTICERWATSRPIVNLLRKTLQQIDQTCPLYNFNTLQTNSTTRSPATASSPGSRPPLACSPLCWLRWARWRYRLFRRATNARNRNPNGARRATRRRPPPDLATSCVARPLAGSAHR